MMVRLAPIGVFGIVGHATGTLSYSEITLLQGYILAFGAASILLCVWVVPALIASVTPFSQREILSALRDTLMTAFIIGNTFVVLPMIVEAVQQLFHRHGLNREDAAHLPEYSVQLAYPFPDIGRIVTLIFIPFAAWFYGMHIAPFAYPKLIGVGVIGAFAKPVVTVPLLLNLAQIPIDIFHLFLGGGRDCQPFWRPDEDDAPGSVCYIDNLLSRRHAPAACLSGWWFEARSLPCCSSSP